MQLQNQDIHIILEDYLRFIDGIKICTDNEEKELLNHLNLLALCQNSICYEFDESDYPDPPAIDYSKLYTEIKAKFNRYSQYNTVANISINISKSNLVIGDSIDDLTDITSEIRNVIWLWENTSVANALWQFQNNFNYHWGEHLRKLQLYIFAQSMGT